MKRSQINAAISQASNFFNQHHWHLPPMPLWDVTDFGLGNFEENGLVLVNLAEEPEYCEKLMYALKNQKTPAHAHKKKKEDIIVRNGEMAIQLWLGNPSILKNDGIFDVQINGTMRTVNQGETISLRSGERITLVPGIYHEFYPVSEECIIGEVSTANDDVNDNFFVNKDIGRFSEIEEDEEPILKLINE
jgi:D-lyxose ketol-isomerase